MVSTPTRLQRLTTLASGPLFLLVPFVVFALHQGYALSRPELLVCLAVLTGVGLLLGAAMMRGGQRVHVGLTALLVLVFADFQSGWRIELGAPLVGALVGVAALGWLLREHLGEITSTVLAVALVSTLVVGGRPQPPPESATEPASERRGPLPAPLIHFVLDEHVGVEGIPAEFDPQGERVRALKRDLEDWGFTVFPRAYSRYGTTQASLPNLFNFSERDTRTFESTGKFVEGSSLPSNAYFEEMTRRGYRIHVIQSDFIDFCGTPGEISLASCTTYPLERLAPLQDAPLAVREKVRAIFGMYLRRADLRREIHKRYDRARQAAAGRGWSWPRWPWGGAGRMSALTSMESFEQSLSRIAAVEDGEMIFYHLLLPHFPYTYDAACRVRPGTADWLTRKAPGENTGAARALRYPLYLDQLACTHARLGELFASLDEAGTLARARILLHSDHGSRIDVLAPSVRNQTELSAADYVDTYSTLFAYREPGEPARYDRRVLALGPLFEAWVRGETAQIAGQDDPWVFLADGGRLRRASLPDFGREP